MLEGGSKNGRRALKIFWEDWYAREISRFVCNKVRLFEVGRLWELYNQKDMAAMYLI